MNKYIWFVMGLIAGSVATYICVRDEFERISDEEIESVKEVYKNMAASKEKAKDNEEQKEAYKKMVDRSGYNYSQPIDQVEDVREDILEKHKKTIEATEIVHHNVFEDIETEKEENSENTEDEQIESERLQRYNRELSEQNKPYTISPEEFVQDKREYDKITLEYYDDGFLVEEVSGDIVNDISTAVGYESLNKFGEYEEDVAYVRNDVFETDYEIIRQHCDYSSS